MPKHHPGLNIDTNNTASFNSVDMVHFSPLYCR